MLLSIVMMMKNEEKYIDKTLKALIPLMNDTNSELIILDTGSTDNSIDIAKKYTDKVYFDTWNDNFADMRNKSIGYAKGDWILILDADEELIKYDKLFNFFNSKLYTKYNSASIELRSLSTQDKKSYSVGSSPRLFRNDKDFRYEGAIHEQPIYKEPMYNNIASFDHYGYMYDNEEIKNIKLKRNEKILLSEYVEDSNNPYICYQLGQNYAAFGKKQDALYYFKKSSDLYKEKNQFYIPAELGLAKTYLILEEYEKCEDMCTKYIENDDKNIDVYYYLMLSQYNLKKYNECLNSYKRYIYLIENFNITTQANDICCIEETVCYKEYAQVKLVDIYYKLSLYEDVVNEYKKLNQTQIKKLYKIIFKSLYKLNKEKEILNIYKEKSHIPGIKKEIIESIEDLIDELKVSDKENIYLIFSELNDNYGTLNKVRLGKKILCSEYNEILIRENNSFYGDLIYYGIKDGVSIEKMLDKVSCWNLEKYIEYIIRNRRECILKLYSYLMNNGNTLNIQKLSLYSIISKQLLLEGNLKDEKCKKIFFMYTVYRYEYLKQLYNVNLTDGDILQLIANKDDIFVMNIINLQNEKNINELEYIKTLKSILIENHKYSEGIQVLINQFENKLKENEELTQLKKQYKNIIQTNIQNQELDIAINMIDEYQTMFNSDTKILNMKAIIQIMKQNFEEAEIILKNSFILNNSDYNTIFNIAYLKECINEIGEAIRFYSKIINNCKEQEIVLGAKEKIFLLNKVEYR